MERPSSDAFQVCPCPCASIVHNRRMAAAGIEIPNWGMSLSRKVRMKPSRQATLSSSVSARNERGKPPRTQRRCSDVAPTSSRLKPARSTNSTRPASDSAAFSIRLRRRTSEDEKAPRGVVPVDQNAENAEQVRLALNLVDHDQAVGHREGEFRVLESRDILRGLQIEGGAGDSLWRSVPQGWSCRTGELRAAPRSGIVSRLWRSCSCGTPGRSWSDGIHEYSDCQSVYSWNGTVTSRNPNVIRNSELWSNAGSLALCSGR